MKSTLEIMHEREKMSDAAISRWFLAKASLILSVAAFPATAQLSGVSGIPATGSPSGAALTTPGGPAVLSGVVVNANTNQPVARALVQVGSQAMLTGQDGQFTFTDGAGTSASLRVTKPGFYDGQGPEPRSRSVTFKLPGEPWIINLYPEGLITGSLMAGNGDPVANIPVQAWRRSEGEAGSVWGISGQTMTNGEGEFRLALPAGDYRIETEYQAEVSGMHTAVLPILLPEASASSDTSGPEASGSTIHLVSGSEQHFDLRAEVHPSRQVRVRVEGMPIGGGFQLVAHTANGLSFFPFSRETNTPGELETRLPDGSYTLTLVSAEGDQQFYGETKTTVTGKEPSSAVLHLSRILPVPVDIAVDPSATSDNRPPAQEMAQELGLHFVRRGDQSAYGDDYGLVARGRTSAFQLLPGRYKLVARPPETWFIESATVGGSDLMTQDFEVEQGGTTASLRIVVSDRTGALRGSVQLNRVPGAGCWIYLIPESPGLTPALVLSSGTDGSFSRAAIPPGNYRAVALEDRNSAELSDPATLDRLSPHMKSLTVAAGATATLEIEAVPALELAH